MTFISYNVNGLRAAIKKGFLDWLATHPADVVCIQEAKAQESDVNMQPFEDLGYKGHWFCAQKKGYSGVTVFSKVRPDAVICGTGHAVSDSEGRVIQLQYGGLRLINAYFPSGTSGTERQTYKMQWLAEFKAYLDHLRTEEPHILLCGDYNIAHTELDLHSPKTNHKSSGFLPEERAWMDGLYGEGRGWIDVIRHHHPGAAGKYTWWTQRFPKVRAENKGWRLDYITASESLRPHLQSAEIYPDVQHSDHCPVWAELNVEAIVSSNR